MQADDYYSRSDHLFSWRLRMSAEEYADAVEQLEEDLRDEEEENEN